MSYQIQDNNNYQNIAVQTYQLLLPTNVDWSQVETQCDELYFRHCRKSKGMLMTKLQ